ncbi:MAG: hypothetical protein HYV96_06205 [Opitutae bacterium]|nr:hypothetical protein [Opitutae bacterium]
MTTLALPSPRSLLVAAGCAALLALRLAADVTPAALFSDHAVLQQGMPLPVWGTASDGERVVVEFAGQRAETTAASGKWRVTLPPLAAGGPHTLTITGQNRVVISDVLIGEVWICSGQSNMEMRLGPASGLQPVANWQPAVAAADLPQMRFFTVPRTLSLTPVETTDAKWEVCSPETAPHSSAVAFFFGRALAQARGVPIGLVHTSWGGSAAEAWMSRASLERQSDFAADLELQKEFLRDPAAGRARADQQLDEWYRAKDPGTTAGWEKLHDATADWRETKVPSPWEAAGLPNFDGIAWLRREFELPADWAGRAAELHLGAIDDDDTTWVNGQRVGATQGWDKLRVYPIPAGVLKAGRNVIAVRVLDTGAGGGIWGKGVPPHLARTDGASVNLSGAWRVRSTEVMAKLWPVPRALTESVSTPSALYNGMIVPLLPYAMRGVIWYQGETNADRSKQYQTLFPALIADWRRLWGEGDFPFLFVQIAPWTGMNPEIREAQLLTMKRTPNTAMAVTLDVGDAKDIHPPQKQPVGERLALAARALAYGEQIEFSGPVFESASFSNGRAVLRFSHVDRGLVAPGGQLEGFTIAGADGVFRAATAKIVGQTVEVNADDVREPKTVRYAWGEAPTGNLFNRAGLPASPFRTDVE